MHGSSAAMFSTQESAFADADRQSLDVRGGHGFTVTTASPNSSAAFLLDRGYYLNINLYRQGTGGRAGALAPLVSTAVAHLP